MASPQLIWRLSKGFFQRNNPVEGLARTIFETVHNLITFNSKMKLLKYKFMIAQQQLNSMENHIVSNPYDIRGNKFDRAF